MGGFSHTYNTDDVIIRAAIVGLVNELNNRINYYNIWEDDKQKLVKVPFFYAMSGDERFIQDAFSNWSDCYPDFIEGNTDPIPRGTLFLTGTSILSNNLTSRYVRGSYNKEVAGELKRYNSYINSLPLQLNFSAEILCDSVLDTLKITQSAMTVLYRTLVFNLNYKGFRVPTQAGFPDTYNSTKQFEFSYGETNRIKTTFDVELQTFLPIPDQAQEFFAGNNMSGGIKVTVNEEMGVIKPLVPTEVSQDEKNYTQPKNDATLSTTQDTTSSPKNHDKNDQDQDYSGNFWK